MQTYLFADPIFFATIAGSSANLNDCLAMPDLLFSIIIPNWNGLRFLETCLNALAAQTYAHT